MTTELEKRICAKCNRDVEYGLGYEFVDGLCGPCFSWKRLKEDENENSKSDLQTRIERWATLCPDTYRENDTSMIEPEAFHEVTSYRLKPRGLLCMGDSRRGKTTTVWRLLETLYVMHGISFKAVTEVEFAQKCSGYGGNKQGFLWELISAKILFLDDLGHASTTRTHLQDLSFVLEKRTSWKKPNIVTTQFSRSELIERARGSEKTLISILNRLLPYCDIVEF